jgi:hypothetical protein
MANAAGSFYVAADAVGQAFRDKVAVSLHYPVTAANNAPETGNAGSLTLNTSNVTIGGNVSGVSFQSGFTLASGASLGLDKTGAGTGVLGGTLQFGSSGSVQFYTPPSSYAGSAGSVTLSAGSVAGSGTYSGSPAGSVSGSTLAISEPSGAVITRVAGSISFGSISITESAPNPTIGAITLQNGSRITLMTATLPSNVPGLTFNEDGTWTYTSPTGTISTGLYTFASPPEATP